MEYFVCPCLNVHGQGADSWWVRYPNKTKWLTYDCTGTIFKTHGMDKNRPAQGILFTHADMWIQPWRIEKYDFDVPWIFEGWMKPLILVVR
ncbi:hypothetical protein CYMTET_45865 [Cymbomonas tetramitiformis]|uniref:Uncharacterized protein n=1 Tax=Cymbomonas tetramitiformis TaxID=36881 RepID=A0AAE0EXV9_9CHLO|nr:hypothetical protein CYMTET_45865 [Cymbomonas tetramitiformis]